MFVVYVNVFTVCGVTLVLANTEAW